MALQQVRLENIKRLCEVFGGGFGFLWKENYTSNITCYYLFLFWEEGKEVHRRLLIEK